MFTIVYYWFYSAFNSKIIYSLFTNYLLIIYS